MDIEILLATYNGEKYLKEQLLSIVNQTNQNWFLTIRDDGSTDSTPEIISSFIQLYPNKIKLLTDSYSRLKSTLSFSKLIEASSGNYMMLCDQDDYWLPTKIEDTLKVLLEEEQKNPDIPIMVFTDMKVVDNNLNILNHSFINSQKLYPTVVSDYHKLIALNVVAGCTTLFNRKSISYITPIISSKIIHDQWIAVNISKFGKVVFLEKQTSLYRQHGNNTVGTDYKNWRYFLDKIRSPIRQFNIYYDLISGLSFKVNLTKFIFYKFLFTFRRLINFKEHTFQ